MSIYHPLVYTNILTHTINHEFPETIVYNRYITIDFDKMTFCQKKNEIIYLN